MEGKTVRFDEKTEEKRQKQKARLEKEQRLREEQIGRRQKEAQGALSSYQRLLDSIIHWCTEATHLYLIGNNSYHLKIPTSLDPNFKDAQASVTLTIQQRQYALFTSITEHYGTLRKKLLSCLTVQKLDTKQKEENGFIQFIEQTRDRDFFDLVRTFLLDRAVPIFRPEEWQMIIFVFVYSLWKRSQLKQRRQVQTSTSTLLELEFLTEKERQIIKEIITNFGYQFYQFCILHDSCLLANA